MATSKHKEFKTDNERLQHYLRDLTKDQRKEVEDWKAEKDALKKQHLKNISDGRTR